MQQFAGGREEKKKIAVKFLLGWSGCVSPGGFAGVSKLPVGELLSVAVNQPQVHDAQRDKVWPIGVRIELGGVAAKQQSAKGGINRFHWKKKNKML